MTITTRGGAISNHVIRGIANVGNVYRNNYIVQLNRLNVYTKMVRICDSILTYDSLMHQPHNLPCGSAAVRTKSDEINTHFVDHAINPTKVKVIRCTYL